LREPAFKLSACLQFSFKAFPSIGKNNKGFICFLITEFMNPFTEDLDFKMSKTKIWNRIFAVFVLFHVLQNKRGTHVKPLYVGKELWPSSSVENIVIQLRPKY
jgi:hypothetical protein